MRALLTCVGVKTRKLRGRHVIACAIVRTLGQGGRALARTHDLLGVSLCGAVIVAPQLLVVGPAPMVRAAEIAAYIMLFAVSRLKQCSGMAART